MPVQSDKIFDRSNPKPSSSWVSYRILNIGNNFSTSVLEFISLLEKELGIKAKIELSPMQQGDVKKTAADSNLIDNIINHLPKTNLALGLSKFIKWYNSYYV